MVLWFRGIGQWRSVLVALARWRHGVLVAVRAKEGDGSENGEASGRCAGCSRRGCPCQGVHGAWPARSGERRRVAPRGQQPLNRSATTLLNCFRKTRFSDPDDD